MQPQSPIVRRYATDAHYSSDAATMLQAGWRVASVSREPSGAIVATYTPVGASVPADPRRLMKPNTALGVALIVGILVAAIAVPALFSYISGSNASSDSQPTSTAFPRGATATSDPNAAATILAGDVGSTAPTYTPAQSYEALAQTSCTFLGPVVTSTWDAAHATVSITAQVGPQGDISALHTTVENIVFDCFKGFYTSSGTSAVQWVDVSVKGPITDAYGNNVIGLYGQADLSRVSARPFNWANLDYLQAWNNGIYDSQWERNS